MWQGLTKFSGPIFHRIPSNFGPSFALSSIFLLLSLKQIRKAVKQGWTSWKAFDERYDSTIRSGKYSFSSLVGLPQAEVEDIMASVIWLRESTVDGKMSEVMPYVTKS